MPKGEITSQTNRWSIHDKKNMMIVSKNRENPSKMLREDISPDKRLGNQWIKKRTLSAKRFLNVDRVLAQRQMMLDGGPQR